jgi:cytochrome c-type biogenesis protein CcmE
MIAMQYALKILGSYGLTVAGVVAYAIYTAVDLTPREPGDDGPRKRRRWGPILVLAVVIAGGGVVVSKFLTSAIDYYCNVDEIGAKGSCTGDRRIRVQGTVDQGSIVESPDGGVEQFSISFNGKSVPVDYSDGAAMPALFAACIPVVVEGRLRGGRVVGTNLEVKHTEKYEAENADRIATSENAPCSQPA